MIGSDLPDRPFPPWLFEEYDADAEDRRAQRIEDDITIDELVVKNSLPCNNDLYDIIGRTAQLPNLIGPYRYRERMAEDGNA